MTLKQQIAEKIADRAWNSPKGTAEEILSLLIKRVKKMKIKCIALKGYKCGNGWSCSACDKNRFIDLIIKELGE